MSRRRAGGNGRCRDPSGRPLRNPRRDERLRRRRGASLRASLPRPPRRRRPSPRHPAPRRARPLRRQSPALGGHDHRRRAARRAEGADAPSLRRGARRRADGLRLLPAGAEAGLSPPPRPQRRDPLRRARHRPRRQGGRLAWIHENFQFFGAPFGVFCFLERSFGPSQWLDLGIYLQTVLLLLTEAGYASCPQADWAMFERTVMAFLDSPPDLTLVCGIAIGYPDPTRPENLHPHRARRPARLLRDPRVMKARRNPLYTSPSGSRSDTRRPQDAAVMAAPQSPPGFSGPAGAGPRMTLPTPRTP